MAPVCSYGIICLHNGKCLVVQRRDSFGYLDVLRGKYTPEDREYMQRLVDDMTRLEQTRLATWPFDRMWSNVWQRPVPLSAKSKFIRCSEVFKQLLAASPCAKRANTWEFPKGRRASVCETEVDCALREFEEETSVSRHSIRVKPRPIVDEYVGFDGVRYRNTYFGATLAHTRDVCCVNPQFAHEINRVRWCGIHELHPRYQSLVKQCA